MKAQLKDLVRGYWKRRRREPYTEAGVRRLRCVRCAEPAAFQWQICSDGNNYRPICAACDVALNRLVLEWMRHPEAVKLAEDYAAKKRPNAELTGARRRCARPS